MASSSGSGGKSPSKLREVVNSSKYDCMDLPEELKANLEKLRALSKDDLTENGLLRSRIDQQCELICILKQRADESLKKSMALENQHGELQRQRDDILSTLHNETRKFSVLEKRFLVLNQNHEELIKIKDDYKAENERLRIENGHLKKENEGLFGSVVEERDSQIQLLREEVKDLQRKYQTSVEKERAVLENLSSLEKKCSEQARAFQQEITFLQKNSEEQQKQLGERFELFTSEKEEKERRVLTLLKERDDFAQLALDRGKALEEKQKEIKGLCLKLEETEGSLKESEDNFLSEMQKLSVNAQVLKLKNQLEDAERKQRETQKEYDAYKRHMSALLGKEKELNNKLRILIG
ncbi:coiled-coil domain-containing protein 89-like [Montipora foliosa]|uniref:coiled-coil domain-containing protein 89-like n=1 Tax=Montipora foliosa TaxID=591990 RepID=UPI0035F1B62E